MTRRRIFQVLLGLTFAVLVFVGLSRISFNVDILKLLPPQLKEVQGLSLYLKHFARPTELIITVETPDPEDAEVFADSLADFLAQQPNLIKSVVHRPPWEDRATETSELIAWLWLSQSPEKVDAMIARLGPDEIDNTLKKTVDELSTSLAVQEVATLSYDPLRLTDVAMEGMQGNAERSEFSSADGTFRVLYVEAASAPGDYRGLIKWVGEIETLLEKWKSKEDGGEKVSLGITGEPAFVAEISGGMERDMNSSMGSTMLTIAAIFWLFYRSVKPVFWLMLMLVVVFVGSLAISGFVLSELTVISVGFASILMGLSDYGVIVYGELLHNDVKTTQRRVGPSIIWAALTTAAAFFCLNASGLPGLSQLGTMVAIGVLLAAAVMLIIFPPIVARSLKGKAPATGLADGFFASAKALKAITWTITAIILLSTAGLFLKGLPALESNSRPLRPRHSVAYDTMERIYKKLADSREMLSLIITGRSEEQVRQSLQEVDAKLAALKADGLIRDSMLPLPFWPAIENQKKNLPRLQALSLRKESLEKEISDAGFTDDSFGLVNAVFQHWSEWSSSKTTIWPTNDVSRWILRQNVFHDGETFLAVGLVRPADPLSEPFQSALQNLQAEGIYAAGWEQLGRAVTDFISARLVKVLSVLGVVVIVMLWLAFRKFSDVALVFVVLLLSTVSMLGAMSLFNLTWNLFNMASGLLLLGTGVDYSIHVLLALRKNGGDVAEMQKTTGKAILVCGLTTVVGFGSLSWASNIGLASLGAVCAIGILLNLLISIFLLPHIGCLLRRNGGTQLSSALPSSYSDLEKK